MKLLENARKSIILGVEDYQSEEPDRLLSAIRNLSAGVLLLYKEKLRLLSPFGSDDVLIKARILPKFDSDGNIVFTGKGKKTVDVFGIQERFKSLGIEGVDWKRFQRVVDERNNVEHYYPHANREASAGLIADACVLICEFIKTALGDDPRAVLGEECYQALLEVSEVHEHERKRCLQVLEAISWRHPLFGEIVRDLACEHCGSQLFVPLDADGSSGILSCRSCAERLDFGDGEVVERLLLEHFGLERHLAAHQKVPEPLAQCSECGREAIVVEDPVWECLACEASHRQSCLRCDSPIPVEETMIDGTLCGWCSHMSSKAD